MKDHPYDPHESCRQESEYWRQQVVKAQPIKQVVQICPDGTYQVLKIHQVDSFIDGLRILVQ